MLKLLVLPLLSGFVLSVLLGYVIIPKLRELRIGQYIREEVAAHKKKAGTPTMGGIFFILAIILSRVALFVIEKQWPAREELLILGLTLSYGFIGFLDDYKQIRLGRSLGLRAREKMALQVLFAASFMYFFVDRGSEVILPFSGRVLHMGILYPILGILLIVGIGNGMNFTDGLDGLAAGVATFGLGAYAFIANEYAGAVDRPELAHLTGLALASAGALLGFLVYNYNPAKVFMGDTGSLALGGLLAGYAVVTRTELVLPLIAIVQLVEVVSVILQVFSFQVFGKRIFRMTPIHHHFELLGWSEKKIVYVFWLVALAGAILGIASMGYV
ncbi:MAG TPA: phospho-N-acetylmuramoyl-pentapeptide-transferase [Firmicutes bacterium]|nr:phospho-N-acetylmuramoyl-pentapeptide-transferase [Bacillota bacterium]